MKGLLAATAFAVFGLAPAIGAACEYMDETSASATPPARLASAPAATKAPQAKIKPGPAAKASKQDVAKAKTPAAAPEQKVAAATSN